MCREAALTASLSVSRLAGSPPTMWKRTILSTAESWHIGREMRDSRLQAQDEQAVGPGAGTDPGGLRVCDGLWRASASWQGSRDDALPWLIYNTWISSWVPLRRWGSRQPLSIK